MQRIKVDDGIELEYEVFRDGEPVLLVHGGHIADALRPLAVENALEQFQVIHYHRRGFAGSSRCLGPTTIEKQAGDGLSLLNHLGIGQAHVVGHSAGAWIALSLAATEPERVRSLALLEPPGLFTAGPAGAAFADALADLADRYRRGDAAGAVHAFFALANPDWRAVLERNVPGAVEQAEKDASTFFDSELPPAAQWSFGPEQASPISCPVLSVLGTDSGPPFVEGRELVHECFPQCEDADIVGATHLLQMEQPRMVAQAVAAFLLRQRR